MGGAELEIVVLPVGVADVLPLPEALNCTVPLLPVGLVMESCKKNKASEMSTSLWLLSVRPSTLKFAGKALTLL